MEKYMTIEIFQDPPLQPSQIDIKIHDNHQLAYEYLLSVIRRYISQFPNGDDDDVYSNERSNLDKNGYVSIGDLYLELRKIPPL